jgi:hypothetical protein
MAKMRASRRYMWTAKMRASRRKLRMAKMRRASIFFVP